MTDALPELVTYADAERLLNASRSTVQRLIASGDLEAVKITSKAVRIRLDSIERHIRRRQVVVG